MVSVFFIFCWWIGRLSKHGVERWQGRLSAISEIRVVAMIWRRKEDGNRQFMARWRSLKWEIPLVEVVFTTPCIEKKGK